MMDTSATELLICRTLIGMMKEKPYYSIKVTDLVKQAGISRSSFYVYFDSVFDVLQKIEDTYLGALPEEEEVKDITRGRFYRNEKAAGDPDVLAGFRFVLQNMELYRALTGANGEPSFYIRFRNRHSRIYTKILEEEMPSLSEAERAIISTFLAGGKMAVQDWWAHHTNQVDVDEYMRISDDLYSELFYCILKRKK